MPNPSGTPVGSPATQAETAAAIFTGSKQQQINNLFTYIQGKYGPKLAGEWRVFATSESKADPSLTAKQLLEAWVVSSDFRGVASGIQTALNVLAETPQAVATGAENAVKNLNPVNWLTSIGGGIASGIESGFVNILKDVWKVLVGGVEILGGVIIVLLTLGLAFKGDILALGQMAGM